MSSPSHQNFRPRDPLVAKALGDLTATFARMRDVEGRALATRDEAGGKHLPMVRLPVVGRCPTVIA